MHIEVSTVDVLSDRESEIVYHVCNFGPWSVFGLNLEIHVQVPVCLCYLASSPSFCGMGVFGELCLPVQRDGSKFWVGLIVGFLILFSVLQSWSPELILSDLCSAFQAGGGRW